MGVVNESTKGPWIQMDDNTEANSRLIAAAPELLEALIEAYNIFDNYPEIAREMIGTYEVINQAIAKATGGE